MNKQGLLLRVLLTLILFCTNVGLYAYDFESNGIYYNLKPSFRTVEVVSKGNGEKYTDIIVIPESISYKGVIYSVTSIGGSAFGGCSGLTSITIPNSVTSIGNSAFYGCSGLTSITIPNSVVEIFNYAFAGCSSLTKITVSNGNHIYDSRNNCNAIIETSSNTLITGCKTTIIPNSVTSIGDTAFKNCSNLTSITIPNSITSIGNYAFSGCSSLTSITIPNSVTMIGRYAFSGCSGLTSITIPNSITTIGDSAFSGCSGLSSITIPNSVTSIDADTFSGCSGLTSITIPNSITSIGNSAFFGCSGLTSITIPNSVTSIGDNAFSECSGLTSITVSNGNTKYDSRNNCNAIIETSSNALITGCKTTIIPNSVTSIGRGAFFGCSSLTSITIPNTVTTIGQSGFSGCSGLTSITIPNSVTSIGYYAFSNCSGLTSITIPNSVTYISYNAFSGCSGLTSITIPNSVTSISNNAFSNCSGLTSITIPNSVTSIGDAAFSGCISLTSITIPFNVMTIGDSAFNGCSGLTFVVSEIQNPFWIDKSVFRKISSNATLQVPEGTKSKYEAFSGWTTNFKDIIEDTSEEVNDIIVDDLTFSVVSHTDNTLKLTSANTGFVLTVPATITANGKTWKVTEIDQDAFKYNTELAAIIWNPEAAFAATVSNPNLLLYVKKEEYAPAAIQNVVVNGTASNIVLKEATNGNNFYCPQSFVAQKISFTHNYQMQTGIGESRGWETIALPFDVQSITHQTVGAIKPFAKWKSGDSEKPFWLYELTGTGWNEADGIKAYTPYIISMPNNSQYDSQWILKGSVTFAASNVTVGKTENVNMPSYRERTFVPCYANQEASADIYALNVKNDYVTNSSNMTEGSWFVQNLRQVHPFEAYMTSSSQAQEFFGVLETGIETIDSSQEAINRFYDLQGRMVQGSKLPKGVYIMNGKKMLIK